MTALQASIGILNDVVDAPRDAGRKPSKPIPAGLVREGRARFAVVVAAALGLVLAAPSGPAVVALGAAILAIGSVYDLRLKGTPWSWAPFAVGIPLLPVFAWLGAAGSLPPFMGRLVAAAVLAGAMLAISNARADAERDRAARVASVATALGTERSWWLALGLAAAILAVAAGPVLDAVSAGSAPPVALIGVVAGAGLLLGGAGVGYRVGARAPRTCLGAPGGRDRRAGGRLAGRGHRPALTSGAGVVAPDHRDHVLELELRDREVLGEVRTVGVRDRMPNPGVPKHVDQLLDRIAEALLRIDQRVLAEGLPG